MASIKEYLEQWRELYSFPNHITGNEYLTESGRKMINNSKDWNAAQYMLLKGNAIGTADKDYLNPTPLFNKLGYIYSRLVNSAFVSARTDSIKMNLNNMDYTNGSTTSIESVPRYNFFNFYNYDLDQTENEIFYAGDSGLNSVYLSNFLLPATIGSSTEQDSDGRIIYRISKTDAETRKTSINKSVLEEIIRFNEIYTLTHNEEQLTSIAERFGYNTNTLWNRYDIIDDTTSTTASYYGPSLKMNALYLEYCLALTTQNYGLQLLMPQYHRRVEVEDLDKNFWVISQLLDAVVNALWGPDGLIDVVRKLILKVKQIEEFLGLDHLDDIELMHSGSDDMYFDMYSRFTLSGLEIKLKGSSGERVLKNIFKPHSETSDRKTTSDMYKDQETLFYGIQTEEIIPSDGNSTGLYDSDLISSDEVTINGKTGVVSLSSVIDAINNAIVEDKVGLGTYTYGNLSDVEIGFFTELDLNADGIFTAGEIRNMASDVSVEAGDILSPTQVNEYKKYENAHDYLIKEWAEKESLENKTTKSVDEIERLTQIQDFFNKLEIDSKEEIERLFKKRKVLSNISVSENGDELLKLLRKKLNQCKSEVADLLNYWTMDGVSVGSGIPMYTADNLIDLQGGTICTIKIAEDNTGEDNTGNSTEDNVNELYDSFTMIESQIQDLCLYGYDKKYIPTAKREDIGSKDSPYIYLEGIFLEPADLMWPTLNEGSLTILYPSRKNEDRVAWEEIINKNIPGEEDQKLLKSLLDRGLTFRKKAINSKTSKDSYLHLMETLRSNDWLSADGKSNNDITAMSLVKNWETKTIYKNFIFYVGDFDSVGVFPSENVYVPSLTANQFVGQYVAQKSGVQSSKIKTSFEQHPKAALRLFNATDYKYYLINNIKELDDTTTPTLETILGTVEDNLNVYDCVEIARNYEQNFDGAYNHYIKQLLSDLKTNNEFFVDTQYLLLAHFNIDPLYSEQISYNNIVNTFFTVKKEGNSTLLSEFEVYCPNVHLVALITKFANNALNSKGFSITNADRQALIDSIQTHAYKLRGNILVFLYDQDYYDFRANRTAAVDEQIDEGLYVTVTDGFYTTQQPLISYSNFYNSNQDDTYAFFVPRSDLIDGEILELRLTEKGCTKKMLNLNSLTANGFTSFTDGKKSRLFLSLHNCFSTLESQYNFRTTLFFEDTTPEDVNTYLTKTSNKKLSVDSWFTNGIECQYFRPTETSDINGKITISHQYKSKELKIRASMLTKKDTFIDNSFYINKYTEWDNRDEYENNKNDESDDGNIDNNYFEFSRELAYCAAQRHNLLFYSSPAMNDGDMYFHNPIQILQSPTLRSDESIQSPSWAKGSLKQSCFDVMTEKGQSCYINDIKSMLYKNSKVGKYNVPQCIEVVWGSRKVDDYVKKKKLDYIVIEREPGSRNNTYGPTTVGISYCSGYLHNGITSLGEFPHYNEECQIIWYSEQGEKLNYTENGFPPANAKYGLVDLTAITKNYANAFLIRFYGGDPRQEKMYNPDKNSKEMLKTEFTFTDSTGTENIRRPIFKAAYFFGEDETGRKIADSTGSEKQYGRD